jgi:multidrug efflux pump subunit AcrB
LADEVARLLAEYGETLSRYRGINNVETGAQTGSGSVLISFDPKAADAGGIREFARQIPLDGGFVFFPETTAKERYWEISILGDDDKKCRELAEKLAWIVAGSPLIKEQVLNFKTGSKKLVLLPDRELFAETGTGFSRAADKIRMGVYGPVIYKRLSHSGEIDVRMKTSGNNKMHIPGSRQTREGTLDIMVSAGSRIGSLVQTKQDYEPASIRREDRRRTASITVSTRPMDPRRVKKALAGFFEQLELPPGYSVVFDPDAIRRAESLSRTFLLLFLAVVFCYMIIAAVNESFSMPLAVLSAVLPSLAVPALCLVIGGNFFNSAAACAFIAVSGMTVNAAVLCAAGLQPVLHSSAGKKDLSLYRVLRRKMPALMATTVTTISGALPFLVLREDANTLVRTLSLVSALGVASSCFCAISIVPSLLFVLRKH